MDTKTIFGESLLALNETNMNAINVPAEINCDNTWNGKKAPNITAITVRTKSA